MNLLLLKLLQSKKNTIPHIILFQIGFKKMYKIDPNRVLDYFNRQVSYEKAKQLESVSITQAICFLTNQIDCHNSQFFCHCFLCRICRFYCVLCERDRQILLLIINKSNHKIINDETICSNIIIRG